MEAEVETTHWVLDQQHNVFLTEDLLRKPVLKAMQK